MITVDNTFLEKFTRDSLRTTLVRNNLDRIEDRLKEIQSRYDLPDFLIAGGAIRDCIYGLEPKDYDVFVSLSDLTDDDTLYLYAEGLEELREPEMNDENYEGKDETTHQFPVLYGYDANDCEINLIGRPETNVLDIIPTFDYDMVKGYFKDGEINITEEAVESFMTGGIVSRDAKTTRRIGRWMNRNDLSRRGIKIKRDYETKPFVPF